MDKLTELEARGAKLKARIAEHRARFRSRMISLELKRAVVDFCDQAIAAGMWPNHAAGLVGSRTTTVEGWRGAVAQADLQVAEARLLPVRVTEAPTPCAAPDAGQVPASPRPTSQPVLVSPGGWRVEGLALPDLLALLQTLP